MTNSDASHSDRGASIGEALEDLYLSDAWPEALERRFVVAREAVAHLTRELEELDAVASGGNQRNERLPSAAAAANRGKLYGGPLGWTSVPQFTYDGHYSDGRRDHGTIAIQTPKLAVQLLMRRRLATCAVYAAAPEDGEAMQVGGITQAKKGAPRQAWWQQDDRGV